MAVGSEGSGTYHLSMQLLSAAGITESNTTLVRGDSAKAIAALAQGAIVPIFCRLSRGASDAPAPRATGFPTRRLESDGLWPFVSASDSGDSRRRGADLERNIPPHDTTLVAVSANLAARRDLNASLIPALLNAVAKVHQHGGVLGEKRQFPSVDFVDPPLNEDARRYIVNVPSFLFRWLPYGWAVLFDRLKILIFPILALLIPLFRIAPPLYTWRVRSKIYRWYTAVREIDSVVRKDEAIIDAGPLLRRLAELEREVASVSVPLSYRGELYNLRLHISLLQQQLEKLGGQASRPPD